MRGIQFDRNSQTRIYLLGRTLNSGDFVDRVRAEGELIKLVKELARTIERRTPQAGDVPVKAAHCVACGSTVPEPIPLQSERTIIITSVFRVAPK